MQISGKLTEYSGLAIAYNMQEIFWEIEQYVDPYLVQIMPATNGGYCLHNGDEENDYKEIEISGHHVPSRGAKTAKWAKPNWDKIRNLK